jgi:leucyl aminopeptidase
MKISFSKFAIPGKGAAVVLVPEGTKLSGPALALDRKTKGSMSRAMAAVSFTGKADKAVVIPAPHGTRLSKIVVIGLGVVATLDASRSEKVGAAVYDHMAREDDAVVMVGAIAGAPLGTASIAAHVAYGAVLKGYRFDKYRTKKDKDSVPRLKSLTLQCDPWEEARRVHQPLSAVAAGVALTRDLVTEPANVIYPESFVERCRELAHAGIKVEVLGQKEMKKLGMNALLGVGQGSIRESKLLILKWNGAADSALKPLALIGKGVCFDTGGISLKQPGGMWDMKWDMAGAGAVAGAMLALAKRKAKANVIGLCGLVENMPDAKAQRPGDVVTSMSGQTIEVQNTDAEGRLVLCDVIWYAQQTFQPRAIVDLATLTGAIIQTFSEHYAGLFANDDDLATRLFKAGQDTGERVWRLPMGDEYDKDLKSLIADMKNIGGGRAGSITAAQFLKRFVKDTPWAHLDIAGTVWNDKGTALAAPGATGFGVRLLNKFVQDNYE